jgi:hypothetical protein
MASKRIRLNSKAKSMTPARTRVQRLALFGPPPLLEEEDAASYDELLARICAAVRPVDIIDEIFVADVVFLEWDILRLRRVKSNLLRGSGRKALEDFFRRTLHNDLDSEGFLKKLHKIIAEEDRAKELARAYARREPDAIKQVDELLASSGLTMHDIMAEGLTEKIDEIERIDRLITIAETRRNASLREIDRRRAVLGEALRRNVQEIEDGEFEVIETTRAEGKSAA